MIRIPRGRLRLLFWFPLILLSFGTGNAQVLTDAPLTVDQLDSIARTQRSPHLLVYNRAKTIGDYHTAISALQYYLLEDEANMYVQDTLVAMYANTGQFAVAAKLAEEYVQARPKDLYLLDMLAAWYDSQGMLAQSLEMYTRIREQVPEDSYTLYQISVLELRLERYGEARKHAEELTALPSATTSMIRITIQEGSQDVPATAAAWNLIGNIDLAMGKKKEAKEAFEKALQIQPDFKLAKNNLQAM